MKRFFLRLTLFLVTSFLLINLVAAIYGHFSRSRYERDGSETYDAIRRAELPSTCSRLVLGDSVSHQLLLGVNLPDTLNLSSNQAISMYGQYMLAHEAIAHDPALKQITLAYQPACFGNDLTQKFTFNYVVKPFYVRPEMRAGMDEQVIARLNRRPVFWLMNFPMFRYTDLLSSTDYSETPSPFYRYLSPVSVNYLRKLGDLCQAKHIQLRIVSTPISRTSGYEEAQLLKEIDRHELGDLFPGYVPTIRQVDPAQLIDNVHFKPEFIRENSPEFVKLLGD